MKELEYDKNGQAVQAFSPGEIRTVTGTVTFGPEDMVLRGSVDILYTLTGAGDQATILAGSATGCRNKTFYFGAGSYIIEVM